MFCEGQRGDSAGIKEKDMKYLVVISKEKRSDFGAHVPDLPGCVAVGKTMEDALQLIKEAVKLHVKGLKEDGLSVPRPRQSFRVNLSHRKKEELFASINIAA